MSKIKLDKIEDHVIVGMKNGKKGVKRNEEGAYVYPTTIKSKNIRQKSNAMDFGIGKFTSIRPKQRTESCKCPKKNPGICEGEF